MRNVEKVRNNSVIAILKNGNLAKINIEDIIKAQNSNRNNIFKMLGLINQPIRPII